MQFFCKKKLKSEIFNNKKSFNITGIFTEKLKNPVFRQAEIRGVEVGGWRGVRKKGWTWTCRFKWGIWQKRRGGVFEGELKPQCTLWCSLQNFQVGY